MCPHLQLLVGSSSLPVSVFLVVLHFQLFFFVNNTVLYACRIVHTKDKRLLYFLFLFQFGNYFGLSPTLTFRVVYNGYNWLIM